MKKKLGYYFNSDGVKVTVFEPAKPRKEERTWTPFSKYSIANVGHQASSLGRRKVYQTA